MKKFFNDVRIMVSVAKTCGIWHIIKNIDVFFPVDNVPEFVEA
jgi:hypothetical protein